MTHQHDVDCNDTIQNLNNYIDGELDSSLCSDIEAHLKVCPKCRVVVNTLKKTIQLFQADGEETVLSPEARQRLFSCLDLDENANAD
jgi:predicted anti-sigma-YlaC factor YlaD